MPLGTPGVQLGTAHPGYSGGFVFNNVPFLPGGTITYTADHGAPGNAPLTHFRHVFTPIAACQDLTCAL